MAPLQSSTFSRCPCLHIDFGQFQEVHGVPQAAAGPGGPAEAGGDRLDSQERVGKGHRVRVPGADVASDILFLLLHL